MIFGKAASGLGTVNAQAVDGNGARAQVGDVAGGVHKPDFKRRRAFGAQRRQSNHRVSAFCKSSFGFALRSVPLSPLLAFLT